MKKVITEDMVHPLLETRFIKVYDLEYEPGKHYYDATRREKEKLAAVRTDGEFRRMLPDAVSCCVVLLPEDGDESRARILLMQEYRYPTGQFLLSPPAGLIDPKDAAEYDAVSGNEDARTAVILNTAVREIREETGLSVTKKDRAELISPLLFSSPGMTDESNALVCTVVRADDLSCLSHAGAEGSELFDGFCLLTADEARKVLKEGRDADGKFYSVFTWIVLSYFVSGMWKE